MTPEATSNAVNCKKFALVVPTLNEAANIVTVLDRAREALSQLPLAWEILIVDDDSTDGTSEIVRRYSGAHPEIRLVERHAQTGLAGAIAYGWEHTDADVLGVMDADLQHPPELLPDLVTRVCQSSHIAIASRYLHANSMAAWNLPRRMISRLSVLASKPVQRSGLRVSDPMSGFFVLRRECIAGMEFQSAGFKLLLEILAKGRIRSVAEIPFKFGTRSGGKSKADGMTAVHYLSLLCRLSREMVFGRNDAGRQTNSSAASSAGTIAQAAPPSGTQRTRSLDVILGLLPLVLGLQLLVWIVYLPVALRGDADFRAFYSAGYMVRSGQGGQLYDSQALKAVQDARISRSAGLLPYTHPPFETLLFAPFSIFPYRGAYLIFLGLNLTCLLICYRLLRKKLWLAGAAWNWLPLLLFINFMPVAAALMQGQDSLILLLLLSAAFVQIGRGNDLIAGSLLGLSLFRFQILLPIAFLFFLWRKWHLLASMAVLALFVFTLSIFVSGAEGIRQYLRFIYTMGVKLAATSQVGYVPVAAMPNLRGLLLSAFHLRSGSTLLAVTLAASLLLIFLAAWAGHSASADWQLSIAITVAALVGYHMLTHDLCILLIPMAMLLDEHDARGLWNIPFVWLSTVPCFFAYSYLAALPVLGLFLFLVWRCWRILLTTPARQQKLASALN